MFRPFRPEPNQVFFIENGYDAIRVTDALARVDHEKCTGCGKCVEKCPVKVIRVLRPEAMAPED